MKKYYQTYTYRNKKTKKKCCDCNKSIKWSSVRCKKCYSKTIVGKKNGMFGIHRYGKKASSYKDGRSLKKYFCMDCEKEISWQNKSHRCRKCFDINRQQIKIQNYCKDCTTEISQHAKRCRSCAQKFNCITYPKPKGKLAFNYIHGQGYAPYPPKFNDELKLKIRKRDNYTCQKCNITEEEHIIAFGQVLHVHHIDYNKDNCLKNNLISLCQACNIRANFNINYWQEYFTKKVQTYV